MKKLRLKPDIIEFVTDNQLLGLSISPAQEACLRSIYGLPLADEQRELFYQCTGRSTYSGKPFAEASILAGARGGKDSRIAAPIVCYEAIFGGHEGHLGKGERGVVPLVAQDFRANRIAFHYIKDYLVSSPLLAGMIDDRLTYEIKLSNRMDILCFPCTNSALRGWSNPAGVLDELAFFRLEGSSNSDAEIQASIRRGMIGFPSTRLVKISTPYMKSGVLWEDFKAAWAQDHPDLLVWRASSVLMNPTLLPERLEREKRLDPSRYAREYEAEFAEDLEAFLPSAWVDEAVVPGRHELPPVEGVIYLAAVDPSGGGPDHFTFAIVHTEGTGQECRVVQDVMRGWSRTGSRAPDLAGVVSDISVTCKAYRLKEAVGDRYAGDWIRQAFEQAGITYKKTELDKSKHYQEAGPLFAQGRMEILDHPLLVRELKTLERRPRSGGQTVVDHPARMHDDYANVLCLAASVATSGGEPAFLSFLRERVKDPSPPGLTQPAGSAQKP